jgi:hypothetical protein
MNSYELPSPGDWFPGREEVRVGETERWLGAAGCGGSIQNTYRIHP